MTSSSQDTTAVVAGGDAVGEEGLAPSSTPPSLSSRVLGAAATEITAEGTTWEKTNSNDEDMELDVHGAEGAETSTIPTADAEEGREGDSKDVAYDDNVLREVDDDGGQGFLMGLGAGGSDHDEEKDNNIQEEEEEETSSQSGEVTKEKKETLDLQQEQEPGAPVPTSSSASTEPLLTSGGKSNKQDLLDDPAASDGAGERSESTGDTGDNDDIDDGHDHHPGHRGGLPVLGMKSPKAQTQVIILPMEPELLEEEETGTSSLASGSIGLDQLCDGHSKGPVRIPPREPPQPSFMIVGMTKMEHDEPPQTPPREDARSKFMMLQDPESLPLGTVAPNTPGIFSAGGRRNSSSRENNLSHEDSFVEPPFHNLVVSAIAVPIQDTEYEQQATDQVNPPESPPTIHDGSGMQSPPSEEGRVRISKCHVFATTAVLVAIIIGLSIGLPIALKRQPATTDANITTARPTQGTEGTEKPTTAPDRQEEIKSIILDGGISSAVKMSDLSSPQYKASMWLANDDTATIPLDNHTRVIQRYALAVLYYATFGDRWISQHFFLSPAHECTWGRSTGSDLNTGIENCNGDKQVSDMSLSHNGLAGSIPSEIGTLTSLTNLNLSKNKLTGTIPHEFGSLTQLTTSFLWDNRLSGTIPDEIGLLTGLTTFDLYANQLSGTIPTEIGLLTGMTQLFLFRNKLTGTIPEGIGSLTGLTQLSLAINKLTGTVPSSLTNLMAAHQIDLFQNDLTGSVNFVCDALPNLEVFYVDNSELECKCCDWC